MEHYGDEVRNLFTVDHRFPRNRCAPAQTPFLKGLSRVESK